MNHTKPDIIEKKQLIIFLAIAFVLPYLMGVLMGYAYKKGIDVSCFPNAQMYYPAAGIMLATLLIKKEDTLVPRRFYICFITITAMMLLLTIISVWIPSPLIPMILNLIIILGSIISWIFLLTEKKEKREAYGLRSHHAKASIVMVVLFLVLYFGRTFLSLLAVGQSSAFMDLWKDPVFYMLAISLPINYFLVFTAFFGEEYGWRYYFTPFLQKHFGKVKGVLLLGVLWGLWHLPINVFYYSPQTWLLSVISQQITCIGLGIFFTYAYMKTKNIWVPVILHFLNNNLIAVLNGGNVSVISDQVIRWNDILILFVFNLVLFVPFIFAKEYRRLEDEEN